MKAARRARKTRKHRRLTDAEIVTAVSLGRFDVDDAGRVYAVNSHRKQIATYRDHKGRECLYLYFRGGRRNTTVGRAVWMVMYCCAVPEGYDVDHANRDRDDHRPSNLRLLESAKNRANKTLDEEFGEF